MPALLKLEDPNIEFILRAVAEIQGKTFGEIKKELQKTPSLRTTSEQRVTVYFALVNKPDYTITVDARDGSMDPDSGKAGIQINYHSKNPVKLRETPETLRRPTSDLGGILQSTQCYKLGIDYMTEALQKAGFKWTAGAGKTRTYEAEAQFGQKNASITIDLRETPDNPKNPHLWYLEISARISPHTTQPEKPKQPTRQYCQQGLFASANP